MLNGHQQHVSVTMDDYNDNFWCMYMINLAIVHNMGYVWYQ